jgi:DEAD/DEAH box helicase domain-containing protein
VESLDLAEKIAQLRPVQVDYITAPMTESSVQLLDCFDERRISGGTKSYGEIAVTTQVVGYRKVRWLTHENLGEGQVSLPPTELHTTAYWLSLNGETVAGLRDQGLWSNDPNNYGPNWLQQRDLTRKRDHYRCVNCGTPESGQAHPVHHKFPFRQFSSYFEANVLENLATLCTTCHRLAEAAVRLRSGLAGVANTLAHIAPLFLMCDLRDIGIHSDPQSPLSDGMPTIVIYDQIPAGIGFSERLYDVHDELVIGARDLVKECDCLDGCPSCVGAGGEHGYGGKREAVALLTALAIQ